MSLAAIKAIILSAAISHGVSAAVLDHMAACESSYDPAAVGDSGTSLGLYQLHVDGELGVFYARGYTDPFNARQAADFTADEVAHGKGQAWTCFPGPRMWLRP